MPKFTQKALLVGAFLALAIAAGCNQTSRPTTPSPTTASSSTPNPKPTQGNARQATPMGTATFTATPPILPTAATPQRAPTTPTPPTSIPGIAPPPPPKTITLKFPPGTTQITVGCAREIAIQVGGVHRYEVWLMRGQLVSIGLEPDGLGNGLLAKIFTPKGKVLGMLKAPSWEWNGTIPTTGKYTILVFNQGKALQRYVLTISAPAEIHLQGATTVIQGRIVGGCGAGLYILPIPQGMSRLGLRLVTKQGKGRLVLQVVGMKDHIPYLRGMMGMSEFPLQGLPPQKYLINVLPWESLTGTTPPPSASWSFELFITK